MKKLLLASFFCLLGIISANAYNGIWQPFYGNQVPTKGEQQIIPSKFQVFTLNTSYLKNLLFNASQNPEQALILELPTPDGGFKAFKIWQDPVMEEGLAMKYSSLKTFTAVATDNKFVTAKLDFTLFGFHAMIYDGSNSYFIDPYSNVEDGFYTCYFKKDYSRPLATRMACEVGLNDKLTRDEEMNLTSDGLPNMQYKLNGTTKKIYRLALACTAQYAVAVAGANPTKAAVLSKMITSVNRVSGVYEREFAIHLNLINNTDTLIFLVAGTGTSGYDATTNPYHNSNGGTMLNENQNTVNARIGSANYDIGHVFSTGGGGIASLGCVCGSNKAQGVTGSTNPVGDSYDIDYVAHEMGHQFGANHTFNANTGSCSGNGNQSTAYEPGSGTTIMAYAGICGSANDMQMHSDPYFHAISLTEISNYVTTGTGKNCPTTTPSGDTPPSMDAFSATYWIPELTPFELTAPTATDIDHDTLTYCWEQWNLGDYKKDIVAIRKNGPIFRSLNPTNSPTRIFTTPSKLTKGITNYLGEKLPDTSRFLWFKVTVRDIYNGIGTFNFPTDTVKLNVDSMGSFYVSSQTSYVTYTGSTNQLVTWNIANTNAAPVNCSDVEIYYSIDSGYTFPYVISSGTPNDGSETVKIPNIATTKGRIKVKGKGNVFFNISTSIFKVDFNTGINDVNWAKDVQIYPIPTSETLHIDNATAQNMNARILNNVGQIIWNGILTSGQTSINVKDWSRGVYFVELINTDGQKMAKTIVIQ